MQSLGKLLKLIYPAIRCVLQASVFIATCSPHRVALFDVSIILARREQCLLTEQRTQPGATLFRMASSLALRVLGYPDGTMVLCSEFLKFYTTPYKTFRLCLKMVGHNSVKRNQNQSTKI
ncbi:hypothetical protein CEXT_447701 [Caerostris extrusa]|uniref:Secreted protein n=1 Tax=Caerostris extrusa TaxID=172846 RepID=A0AAV4URR4_CAEEX|nr:hypothetical protein CEXT_447701 [Caerostris extrusa]